MTSRRTWSWRNGVTIVALGALSAGCTPGNRAATPSPQTPSEFQTGPATRAPAPGGAPAPSPAQATGAATTPPPVPTQSQDQQAIDKALSQIDTELHSLDQPTPTDESDVPSN